uniref:Reverse transcriptase domain-containing protein n=1 Tax=Oreochromis niloticus TaxID=8128 RepID=A0A669CTI2_ORENI
MTTIDDISCATDNNKYTIGVFIDLKKAFDTMQHSILISKLNTYGVRGIALNWLSSYLENRTQYVHYLGNSSERLKIECGVPQGSVLGPKLFNLYINDICDVSKMLNFVLFADDTNFYCAGDKLKELAELMVSEMEKLKKWFDVNKLSLNLTKTKFMIFGNRVKQDEVILSIDGVPIERVTELRFLGVVLDDKLKWKSHIEYVRKKMVKNIYILGNVRDILDYKAMRILYFSLIFPYLSYCAEVWGNTYATYIHPLYLLQKKVVRMVHNVKYREHTNNLFIKSKLLKFEDLVKLQTLLFMCKAKNNTLPLKLQSLFVLCSGSGDSRRKFDFKHKFARTTQRQMCPTVKGIRIWNCLEDNLKSCTNMHRFKMCYILKRINQYEEHESN